jgi:hypothetical protein
MIAMSRVSRVKKRSRLRIFGKYFKNSYYEFVIVNIFTIFTSYINTYTMFILRKISPNSFGQENLQIGDFYRLSHFIYTPADFKEALKEFDGSTEVDKVYGFVHYNNGHDIYPLYNGDQYYIMTENGKTFDNLTNKFYESNQPEG